MYFPLLKGKVVPLSLPLSLVKSLPDEPVVELSADDADKMFESLGGYVMPEEAKALPLIKTMWDGASKANDAVEAEMAKEPSDELKKVLPEVAKKKK